jgi:hypothetical protein
LAALPTAFLAAAMRSGSTHIKNCFLRIGFRPSSTHITFGDHVNEEHMVDGRSAALLFPLGGFVFQQHVRAIGRNVPLLKEFGVRPIVLYRNVLDSIVSWKESADRDTARGYKQASHSPTYMPDWPTLSDRDKLLWITYNIVPWYYSFYVSWREADIESLFVNYDDFFRCQWKEFGQMTRHLGLDLKDIDLKGAVGGRDGKFNVGVSGRGDSLPDEVINIADRQASSWGVSWQHRLEEDLLCKRA